jgi:hypothetical protein
MRAAKELNREQHAHSGHNRLRLNVHRHRFVRVARFRLGHHAVMIDVEWAISKSTNWELHHRRGECFGRSGLVVRDQ